MLTQLFRDSEAAQCDFTSPHRSDTFINPYVHPSIHFIYNSPQSFGRLFLGSLPHYGMVPIITGAALFHQYSDLLVQP